MAVDPPFRIKNMVPGMIMIWYGSIATIPSGWHLCDGTMGTPNLNNKFVIGAGLPVGPGGTGGSTTHTHTFTGDGHAHTLAVGAYIETGTTYRRDTDVMPAIGTTGVGTNLPPWHSLCYIMKL